MLLKSLSEKNLLNEMPKFVISNCHYMTIMGSMAYGVSSDNSDLDIYGFCIPPKEKIFPHLAGEIFGFGSQIQRFEQWQQHHIVDPSANGGKGQEYDFSIYNIVKYFQLVMENNPNMIDSLFTPQRCVIHSTAIGNRVRENRLKFLHKGSWFKFKGYSYSQMHKMKSQTRVGSRADQVKEHGYDLKFAYHCVRLLNEVEQILVEGNLDLERNREQLKSIRRGEWTLEKIENYFSEKEAQLELIYAKSDLPAKPNEDELKELLLECLEMHYGTLGNNVVARVDEAQRKLDKIKKIIEE